MNLIWATRGQAWGFRFLLDGGFNDPLVEYDIVFSDVGEDPEVCFRAGNRVALRFPDPLQRKDRAGRIILHEFVVTGSPADDIHSVEDGRRLVWPHVADEYARLWNLPQPPSASDRA